MNYSNRIRNEEDRDKNVTWISNIASGLTAYPVFSLRNLTTFILLLLFAALHWVWRSSLSANWKVVSCKISVFYLSSPHITRIPQMLLPTILVQTKRQFSVHVSINCSERNCNFNPSQLPMNQRERWFAQESDGDRVYSVEENTKK